MRYEFRTEVGLFWITQRSDEPDGAVLGIDEITLGAFETPSEAADAVSNQNTGWEEWDSLLENSGPRDLSEWEEVIEVERDRAQTAEEQRA